MLIEARPWALSAATARRVYRSDKRLYAAAVGFAAANLPTPFVPSCTLRIDCQAVFDSVCRTS